jgi:chemotaxis-related protein WspB
MLLIMCHAGSNRYAFDSRQVSEVLPRVALHPVHEAPPWLAGLLVHRGAVTPVVDLTQLTGGRPCPNRLSSRIVIVQAVLQDVPRRLGVLAEQVGLREVRGELAASCGETPGTVVLGELLLDGQGVFQLIDTSRLASGDRQAVLFPAAPEDR